MLLLTGYIKLPDHKMYWWVARSDSVPPNAFKCILQNLHLCDNKHLDK